MRGEISSAKFDKRHPLDWYVDPDWCAHQLINAVPEFARGPESGLAIWDPCAGMGNTLAYFGEYRFQCFASDVVDNFNWATFDAAHVPKPKWFAADFLEQTSAPAPCHIVCNPPYSYRKGIAEAFVRHALKLVSQCGGRRVCMLLPIKWLSSQARFQLFMADHPPAQVLVFTQRPSMPPGDRIALMGGRAFRGGMIDYCWIVWNVAEPTKPGETRTIWLPPLAEDFGWA